MVRVAITGGIGEGKSTVLRLIGDLGYPILSADAIARDVFLRDEVQTRLARAARIRPPVEPGELRRIITGSPEIRKQVNRITHPLIHREIMESPATFIEIPLLIETCLFSEFDQVWVVTCGVREQRRRLLARYSELGAVEAILSTQLPSRAKIAFADRVIRTNRPLGHVTEIVSEAVSEIRLRSDCG